MTLAEKMVVAPARERVIQDCCDLIDEEVKSKGGFSGIAVKGAYSLVKAVKPRFIGEVIDAMLDEWVAQLEPFYVDWSDKATNEALSSYFCNRRGDVAEKLLGVTDSRAQSAKNATVKKLYDKLRPTAKKQVEEAIPRLGKLVEKHAAS